MLLGIDVESGEAATLLGLILACMALVGWAIGARKAIRAPEVFAFLYVGLIAAWPSVWTDRRFLLPLVPIILLFASATLWQLSRPRRLVWLRWVGATLVPMIGIAWVARTAPGRLHCAAAYRVDNPCDAPGMGSLYSAAVWSRNNTRRMRSSRIENRLFYWYGHRRGDSYRYSSEPAEVIEGSKP